MQKIVVRMPNWLGDVVMSTPALKVLRKQYPDAHITAMCQTPVDELLAHNPDIDELWSYKKPQNRYEKRQIIKNLKAKQFDLGILLTNSLSSAWWFFKGNVKRRIGFASDMRSLLLSHAIPFPKNRKDQHLVLTYLVLFNESAPLQKNVSPQVYVSAEEKKSAWQRLQTNSSDLFSNGSAQSPKIIGISPGAAFGTAKRWLPQRFKLLAEKLANQKNVVIVCLGHANEIPLGDEICQSKKIINLVGKTSLREFIAIISLCDAFVANDSGPMHIAAALQIPLIAIFGPTDPKISRPYGNGVIMYKPVSCSPCHLRICPKAHECMKGISVEEVYQKLMKLW